MNALIRYGWNTYSHSNSNTENVAAVARVTSIKGTNFYLMTPDGEKEAELTGQQLFSLSKAEQPKVGDWVNYIDYGTQVFIVNVLPRYNALSRRSPGKEGEVQVMAANLDTAVIIQGLDHDFNLMRLERYIAQVQACGIKPVILLNKSDLITDKAPYRNQIQKLQRDLPVWFCSTVSGEGLDMLQKEVFNPELTYVLIGSSGVGKSSLVNALLDNAVQDTKTISKSTAKGRHTTTSRQLFLLPNGSLLIDVPGMREFGIGFQHDPDNETVFPAISKIAPRCRYTDCRHITEAGCAVKDAVRRNELNQLVYDSYLKLIREQENFEKSKEEKNREGKRFGKMTREAKAYRKKYKY